MTRFTCAAIVALTVALALASPAAAQWPRSCTELSDTLETHLGYRVNVGYFEENYGSDPEERACRTYHRQNVQRHVHLGVRHRSGLHAESGALAGHLRGVSATSWRRS